MAKADTIDLTGLVGVLSHMRASGVKWPTFQFDTPAGTRVIFRYNNKGQVHITGPGAFAERFYYGSVNLDAKGFRPSFKAKQLPSDYKLDFWSVMQRLEGADIEATVGELGRELGFCCMCGRPLSNPESVRLGMGPICREKGFGG